MAKTVKIALAGEGGQGVQSIAEILAEAAFEEGKEALYIPNFGVEQRGGVSIAYVQIGSDKIGAPKFETADILIPLSGRSVKRTKQYAGKDTVYIYDNSLIEEHEVQSEVAESAADAKKATVKKIIPIPANHEASENLSPRVFNIIILGAVIAATGVLPLETIKAALEKKLGDKFDKDPSLREMNFKALDCGIEMIRKAM